MIETDQNHADMMIQKVFWDILQPGAPFRDAKSRPGEHVHQPGAKQRAVVDNDRGDPPVPLTGSMQLTTSPA
jgi:hypothetical protein